MIPTNYISLFRHNNHNIAYVPYYYLSSTFTIDHELSLGVYFHLQILPVEYKMMTALPSVIQKLCCNEEERTMMRTLKCCGWVERCARGTKFGKQIRHHSISYDVSYSRSNTPFSHVSIISQRFHVLSRLQTHNTMSQKQGQIISR